MVSVGDPVLSAAQATAVAWVGSLAQELLYMLQARSKKKKRRRLFSDLSSTTISMTSKGKLFEGIFHFCFHHCHLPKSNTRSRLGTR